MPTALRWDFPHRIVTATQVFDGFKMAGFQRCFLRREEFLLQGYGLGGGKGQISDFSIEKRAAQKSAQTPPPQRLTRLQRNSARVLTEKKGVFWGCFADKRGSGLNYLTLCFAFSPVFGTLGFSKPLRLKENRRAKGPKINRA
jgi:hypothetical protein